MKLKDIQDLDDDIALDVGGEVYTKDRLLSEYESSVNSARNEIIRLRDEWVVHRSNSGIEARWRLSEALYDGMHSEDEGWLRETLQNGPRPKGGQPSAPRSKVVVNITKSKVKQAVARLCEIVLPTDDRNWAITPTPVPQVAKMLGDQRVTVMQDGQPNPAGETADSEAKRWTRDAEERCEAMQKLIDDQHVECSYNAQLRKVIDDGVKLGTGILVGPLPRTHSSKSWARTASGGYELRFGSTEPVPASVAFDPWDVWFDPACGRDFRGGAGFMTRVPVTRKQIRELIGVPGFDKEQLMQVLREAPMTVATAENRIHKTQLQRERSYELWTYHGEIEADQMERLSAGTDDPMENVDFGVVMMINDHVVGVMPSWIVDRSLPVDVWCWTERTDMPFGRSLPEEQESQQRVVTAAWRQVMDNARFAVGSQIVVAKGLRPLDGSTSITPGKLWEWDAEKFGGKIDDMRKAMAAVAFPSHLADLLAIAKMAQELADQEVNLPQLMAGQQGSAPDSVGGTVLLYQNAMAVLRQQVKLFDDGITSPHIGRYYDWNMANAKDDRVKGDMQVDARGSSALVERDVQHQNAVGLAQVLANPRYAAYADPQKELELILRAMRVQPSQIMADDEQIKRNLAQPAPQDPRIAAAQLTAQTKQAELQLRGQELQATLQQQQVAAEERAADRQYNMEREQGEYVIAMTQEQNERDMQELKLAQEANLSAQELSTRTGIERLRLDTQRQLFNAEALIKAREGSGI